MRDCPPKSEPSSTRHALPSCRHGKSLRDSTTAPSPASTTSTASRAVTVSASPTSLAMKSAICTADSMNSKFPPPASAIRRRSVSSKWAPTPNVLVATRRPRHSAHRRSISPWSVTPAFARPSVRRRQRPTASADRCSTTCSQPRRQPPSRSVWPRGAMRATARDAASRASAVACVVGTTTWMWSSYATTAKRSSSRRQRMPWRTASRACAIFSPPIEPERSRTKARLTGRRPGRFGASGAWISASRKRRLLAPARISWRSARTVNLTFPPGRETFDMRRAYGPSVSREVQMLRGTRVIDARGRCRTAFIG